MANPYGGRSANRGLDLAQQPRFLRMLPLPKLDQAVLGPKSQETSESVKDIFVLSQLHVDHWRHASPEDGETHLCRRACLIIETQEVGRLHARDFVRNIVEGILESEAGTAFAMPEERAHVG
jgi:hypothetical protein